MLCKYQCVNPADSTDPRDGSEAQHLNAARRRWLDWKDCVGRCGAGLCGAGRRRTRRTSETWPADWSDCLVCCDRKSAVFIIRVLRVEGGGGAWHVGTWVTCLHGSYITCPKLTSSCNYMKRGMQRNLHFFFFFFLIKNITQKTVETHPHNRDFHDPMDS